MPSPLHPQPPSHRVAIPGPGSSIGHELALALPLLLSPIRELAEQRVRGGCGEGPSALLAGPQPPPSPSGPPQPTWHPRGRLDVLPVEVGDDGLTLLRGLHPGGSRAGAGAAHGAFPAAPGHMQPPPPPPGPMQSPLAL